MKPITLSRKKYGIFLFYQHQTPTTIKLSQVLNARDMGGYPNELFAINTPQGQFEVESYSGYDGFYSTFTNVSDAGKHRGSCFGVRIKTDYNNSRNVIPWYKLLSTEIERHGSDINALGKLLIELTSYKHDVMYVGDDMIELKTSQFEMPSNTYVSYLGDYKPVTKRPKKTIPQAMGIRLLMNGQVASVGSYRYSEMLPSGHESYEPTTIDNFNLADDLGARTKLTYKYDRYDGDDLEIYHHSNSHVNLVFIDPKLMAEKPKPKANLGGGAPSDTFGY